MSLPGEALRVLDFFLGGSIGQLYSARWFPSGERQRQADEEVRGEFGSLLSVALADPESLRAAWTSSVRGRLALIVLLDQLSRHVFRLEDEPADSPRRRVADNAALREALELLEQPQWDADLSVPEFVFALMPLRHSNELSHYRRLQSLIAEREAAQREESDLLDRFRRQTTRRQQHLEDRMAAVLAEDILERPAVDEDESTMPDEPLVNTTAAFFQRHSSLGGPAFVSLSGGVDSMVLCKILTHLRDTQHANVSRVIAVHIDYANREESAAEAAYVQRWCAERGVECVVRVISEVRRGVTARCVGLTIVSADGTQPL